MDANRRKWLRWASGSAIAVLAGRFWSPASSSEEDSAIAAMPARSVFDWMTKTQIREVLSRDGTSDLMEALREAILWCARNGTVLEWPAGVYCTSHLGMGTRKNALLLEEGARVIWRGTGRDTCIRRLDDSFGPGNFSVLFPLCADRDSEIALIDIRGFLLDGNYRGNAEAIRKSGFNGEQAAFLKVQTADPRTGSVKLARFERIHSMDAIADTIYLGPSNPMRSWLAKAEIRDYVCESRNYLRADIQLGSGVALAQVAGFRAEEAGLSRSRIESEFSTVPASGPMPRHEFRDVVVGQLEVGGKRHLQVVARDVTTANYALLTRAHLDFERCDLRVGTFKKRTWTEPSGSIRDSRVRMAVHDGVLHHLLCNSRPDVAQDLEFERVEFALEADWAAPDGEARAAIWLPPSGGGQPKRFSLRECRFDPRFARSLDAVGYPLVESRGNQYAGQDGYCLKLGLHPSRPYPQRFVSVGDQVPSGKQLYRAQFSSLQQDGAQFRAEVL